MLRAKAKLGWALVAAVLGIAHAGASPEVVDTTLRSREVDMPVTWTVPADASAEAPVAFVLLLHGHGGTRHEAGGFTRLAAKLAEAGIASLRMDFPGAGDSTEPFWQNSLTHMLADVQAAEAWALASGRIDPTRTGVVGFSMGGRVAAMASAAGSPYRAMVMWASEMENGPGHIIDRLGGSAAYAAMRAEAVANGFAPFTTFWGQQQQLGERFFRDLDAARTRDQISRFSGALLFVHGTDDRVIPDLVSRDAVTAASSAQRASLHLIDGADHGFGLFSDPDRYSAELLEVTVGFLIEHL